MEIISLSVDRPTEKKLEEIEEGTGFNGRSELIRKAVNHLHDDIKSIENLEGNLNAVIVVRHPHQREQRIHSITHEHESIIFTQLHSKLDKKNCLQVFHTEGKSEEIISFYKELKGSKGTKSVDILPQN